ncbi:MAG: hypothetical protein IJU78_03115 [Clostridia bacterium]|nr:hypothetical protein [Clostridia bacterium]
MEYLYAVQNAAELTFCRVFRKSGEPRLAKFAEYLRRELDVRELPRTVVLTSAHAASELLSDDFIPLPAYTNDFRVVFAPDIEAWRELYLRQLESYPAEEARAAREYYESALSERHLLQTLGHELVHHSELFSDEAYEQGGAWFEEGMAEYVSRRYFLTPQEQTREKKINELLVRLYEQTHAPRPWEAFGAGRDIAALFYDYWRAFLRVSELVRKHGGNLRTVIEKYGRAPNE